MAPAPTGSGAAEAATERSACVTYVAVYVAAAVAVTVCCSAPASDQDWKSQTSGNDPWGASASTAFAEFRITVSVKGAVPEKVATLSWRPVGTVWNWRSTVCGWMETLAVCVSPPASVAVSWISR